MFNARFDIVFNVNNVDDVKQCVCGLRVALESFVFVMKGCILHTNEIISSTSEQLKFIS